MIDDQRRAQLLDHLLRRDARAATDLAVALVDEGTPLAEVCTQLLSPALIEIGERWQRNEISVADEHAATASADAVLSILSALSREATSDRHVVVACAEGEWHLLPARILTEVLREVGHVVSFLGGSLPAAHLGRFLASTEPDVVALSCSTPLALRGLLSCIEVVHDAGLPVLVGGRALGADDHRARTLGADLWAPDGPGAAALLAGALPEGRRRPTAEAGTALELALGRPLLAEAALDELTRRFPPLQGYDAAQLARTREDLHYILQHAEAAILVRDPSLFDEFVGWLATVLDARGLPPEALTISLESLGAATEGHPGLQELLTSASLRPQR